MNVRISRVHNSARTWPPGYQTDGAAGLDLSAALLIPYELSPGERTKIPTGWAIEVPGGFEGQVRPRSGQALKFGLDVILGTVDSDYRGEVCVIVHNISNEPLVIAPGDRIAQLVIAPVAHVQIEVVDSLSDTARGDGGWGSTGVKTK